MNQQIASWSEQAGKKNGKIKKAKVLGQSAEKNEKDLRSFLEKKEEKEKEKMSLELEIPEIIKKTDFSGCKK